MGKVELDPNWWKKNAPKSIASGQVTAALAEVVKRKDIEKSNDHKGYWKALDLLNAAAAKDEQLAKKANDKAAIALLAELKKTSAESRGQTEGHLKFKGDFVVKGASSKSGVAVPPLKGES
jgi:hypothetical protein